MFDFLEDPSPGGTFTTTDLSGRRVFWPFLAQFSQVSIRNDIFVSYTEHFRWTVHPGKETGVNTGII